MKEIKKYLAEFIGTGVLVLVACGVAGQVCAVPEAGYLATALAFGAIGSAIEGKGKLFFTLTPAMVSRYQPMQDRKGNTVGYTFTLRDGRMLRLVMDRKSQAVPAIPRVFGG